MWLEMALRGRRINVGCLEKKTMSWKGGRMVTVVLHSHTDQCQCGFIRCSIYASWRPGDETKRVFCCCMQTTTLFGFTNNLIIFCSWKCHPSSSITPTFFCGIWKHCVMTYPAQTVTILSSGMATSWPHVTLSTWTHGSGFSDTICAVQIASIPNLARRQLHFRVGIHGYWPFFHQTSPLSFWPFSVIGAGFWSPSSHLWGHAFKTAWASSSSQMHFESSICCSMTNDTFNTYSTLLLGC